MKIALDSLGCKLNQAEMDTLARDILNAGHEVVPDVEEADVYVLNTCTVTVTADAKSRHLLSQARRRNPAMAVLAVGCYAQRAPEQLAAMPGDIGVVGNEAKLDLVAILQELARERGLTADLPGQFAGERPRASLTAPRTRAFVKIQDGCSLRCAYCIVPKVRTGERSIPVDRVLSEVKRLESEGHREVVLTGTRIGAYEDRGRSLRDVLSAVLHETRIPRIRLSSLQPSEISEDLLSMWTDTRLCPHFHLALQSGCAKTLVRMRRPYSLGQYARTVSAIRRGIPEAAITTDVIVGFPGESNDDFEESYRTCRDMGFARIHVFPYSARPGTEAASFSEIVSERMKRERALRMLALAGDSAAAFRARFKGTSRPVLWETCDSRLKWTGFTDNYLRVRLTSQDDLANTIRMAMVD